MPKTRTPVAAQVPISLRLPPSLARWLDSSRKHLRSRNQKVASVLEDASTWYGLPAAMVSALQADAQARGLPALDPREYVRALLVQRYRELASDSLKAG